MQQIPIVVFGLIRVGYETTIYRTRGEHANPYTIDVVFKDYNIRLIANYLASSRNYCMHILYEKWFNNIGSNFWFLFCSFLHAII